MPSGLGGKTRNGQAMLSAGRDGKICEVDCLTREYTKIFDNKQPVTCLGVDNENGYIWFGTPSSTINCFKAPESNRRQWEEKEKGLVEDSDVIRIKGKLLFCAQLLTLYFLNATK